MLTKIKTIVASKVSKSYKKDCNRHKLMNSYIQNVLTSDGYPITLNIEPTNYCNLNCIMCPRTKMNRQIGMMDLDLFKKIIDESKSFVDFVYLHLFGEPTFNKDIYDMIAYAKKAGIKIGLSTNATTLSETNVPHILNSYLDILILSLDNPDVRIGVDYDQIEKNIIYFLNELDKVEYKPNVIIQMIDIDSTRKEQREFEIKFSKFPNAYVKIKDLCTWSNQVDEITRLAKNENDNTKDAVVSKCVEPWRGLTIYWDGTAVPCCNDFDGSYVLGNLTHSTLKSIWNGTKMQELRKSFRTTETRIDLCKNCSTVVLDDDEVDKHSSPFYPFEHEIEYYCNFNR